MKVQLTNAAKQQSLSLNDYIIQYLMKNIVINKIPNTETQQAIEDARAGRNMQKVTIEQLQANLPLS